MYGGAAISPANTHCHSAFTLISITAQNPSPSAPSHIEFHTFQLSEASPCLRLRRTMMAPLAVPVAQHSADQPSQREETANYHQARMYRAIAIDRQER